MKERTDISNQLEDYISTLLPKESLALQSVALDNSYIQSGGMQVPREEAALLAFLSRLLNARITVEVGVFTGYSLIATAESLRPGGRVIGFEINEDWAALAQRNAEEAGVQDRVEIVVGDAVKGLEQLATELPPGSVDLVFIDADKSQYSEYIDKVFHLVRPGGVIVLDNIFWGGQVASEVPDEEAKALRELTIDLVADQRFISTVLTMCDGVLLLAKP